MSLKNRVLLDQPYSNERTRMQNFTKEQKQKQTCACVKTASEKDLKWPKAKITGQTDCTNTAAVGKSAALLMLCQSKISEIPSTPLVNFCCIPFNSRLCPTDGSSTQSETSNFPSELIFSNRPSVI